MKNASVLFLLLLFMNACMTPDPLIEENLEAIPDESIAYYADVESRFEKTEHYIEMRDGIKLYTVVYRPRNLSPDDPRPIMLKRTCYSCAPYGPDVYPDKVGPSNYLMDEGYYFVYQDVRGRWMSEGSFDNMRPHVANKNGTNDIDESSDTYDTIDWLIKNLPEY